MQAVDQKVLSTENRAI